MNLEYHLAISVNIYISISETLLNSNSKYKECHLHELINIYVRVSIRIENIQNLERQELIQRGVYFKIEMSIDFLPIGVF